MTRHVRRGGKVWIRVFPDKRSREAGRDADGSGKGNPERWVAVVRPGRILFELAGVDEQLARSAMERAIQKLPMKARFVVRAGVDAAVVARRALPVPGIPRLQPLVGRRPALPGGEG